MVYSTNPEQSDDETGIEPETPLRFQQNLIIYLEKKGRSGKTVTIVRGFVGPPKELQELGRLIRTQYGVGGSAKNGEILIQGDFREEVRRILNKQGFKVKPVGK